MYPKKACAVSRAPGDPIGGYFQFEPEGGQGLPWLQEASAFQSARAGLAAALMAAQPQAIWAPHYICGVVDSMLLWLGVPIHRYRLAGDLGIPREVQPGPDDWVLCVDYFGLSAPRVAEASLRFGAHRVLVDASQSLYYQPPVGGSVVFSPRKFVGVPDGGLVRTPLPLGLPAGPDEAASRARCQHLATRSAGQVETGYTQFQQAEASLAGCVPQALSNHTRAMLGRIDFAQVAIRRRENYRTLAQGLAGGGFKLIDMAEGMVPLCFPISEVDAPLLRRKLLQRRIFTPTYWADANVPETDHIALKLRDNTLYLPCDQRYDANDMQTIIQALTD